MIEHAADIVPTANEIINAVRACSKLDDQGRWIDPPMRYTVVHVDQHGNPLPESVMHSATRSLTGSVKGSVKTTAAKSAKSQSHAGTLEVTHVTAAQFNPASVANPAKFHFDLAPDGKVCCDTACNLFGRAAVP
jgi:hypothetical protein